MFNIPTKYNYVRVIELDLLLLMGTGVEIIAFYGNYFYETRHTPSLTNLFSLKLNPFHWEMT